MKKRGSSAKKFFLNRKALSTIIITLIMIALALVLVAVVWVVVSNLIKGQTEGISLEKLTFDAEIKEVGIDNSTNNLTLTIQRKAGQGEITGMKFVFENDTDKEIETLSFTLIELGKKRFEFHLNIPVDSIRKISIVPLFQSSGGEETIGNVVDSYKFKGGESGSYSPPIPCTPDCTGKECGNDGCDGSCGTCSSGYTCNASGMCIASSCDLTSALWSQTSVVNGTLVTMSAVGSGCSGVTLNYSIYEDDPLFDDYVTSFVSSNLSQTWTALWTYPGDDDAGTDPRDYYFRVRVVGESEEVTSSNTLSVSQGSASCTPTTCAALGYNCGTWANGTCAGLLNCGNCSTGYSCVSGTCVSSCTPTTCAALGYECGTAANGTCAGTLSCGTCSSGYSCISGTCVEQIGGVNLGIQVSRDTGIAPLSVYFYTDFVDFASGDEFVNRFHHYDYTWNFGDTGSGNWGTTGESKNVEKGPLATHIFEEPGNYVVNLVVRNSSGIVGVENYTISVTDPNLFYSGTSTTCVNNAGDTSFSGCPSGARTISTNDLSTITQYATAGNRVLFKRGSSWTISNWLSWPNSDGPVTIGAYGTGTNPNSLGIYENDPQINVNGGGFLDLEYKKNFIIEHISLTDPSKSYYTFSGAVGFQHILFHKLRISGFGTGLGWAHINDAEITRKDQLVISSSIISGVGDGVVFCGGERLAILGNILADADDTHVLRVWQGYKSVIEHNYISGSSILSGTGRHALKLHGPGNHETYDSYGIPEGGNGLMDRRTEFMVISDNVFGASGPWPVAIGPQNAQYDERLSHIIFERNRFHSDYGTQSGSLVNVALQIWARYITVRNNIFDTTGGDPGYYGIGIAQHATEPPPSNIEIYQNTFYRGDSGSNDHIMVSIQPEVTDSIVRNNLASFPQVTGNKILIEDYSSDLISSNNVLNDNPGFADANNVNPLLRDFSIGLGSVARNAGTNVPVFEDFEGTSRPQESMWDVGAYEYS